ncbi:hypothetical protein ABIB25_003084 [Nakamurella sp. UYEF19]
MATTLPRADLDLNSVAGVVRSMADVSSLVRIQREN